MTMTTATTKNWNKSDSPLQIFEIILSVFLWSHFTTHLKAAESSRLMTTRRRLWQPHRIWIDLGLDRRRFSNLFLAILATRESLLHFIILAPSRSNGYKMATYMAMRRGIGVFHDICSYILMGFHIVSAAYKFRDDLFLRPSSAPFPMGMAFAPLLAPVFRVTLA